ncbi:MAG: ParB/RepB/Spo0J family partition protein [Candidatus Bathyarchaeota archaeon]
MVALKEIKIVRKYLPRKELNDEAVSRYFEMYESGQTLPPIVVQKGTHILIDGYHRYTALKRLGREDIDVEFLEIPESDIRTEAIRRNGKHGVPFSKEDRNKQIRDLRVEENRTESEIAGIVGLTTARVSQILSNLNIKDVQVDNRRKISEENRQKIIELFQTKSKRTGAEIAKEMNVDPSRISQMKKEARNEFYKLHALDALAPTENALLTLTATPDQFSTFLKAGFGGGLFDESRYKFTPEGISLQARS